MPYLFFGVEDFSLGVSRLPQLFAVEVFIVQSFWQLHTTNVQLGFCGDSVDLVDSSEGATIQVERT
jgi:hypothetical protein